MTLTRGLTSANTIAKIILVLVDVRQSPPYISTNIHTMSSCLPVPAIHRIRHTTTRQLRLLPDTPSQTHPFTTSTATTSSNHPFIYLYPARSSYASSPARHETEKYGPQLWCSSSSQLRTIPYRAYYHTPTTYSYVCVWPTSAPLAPEAALLPPVPSWMHE